MFNNKILIITLLIIVIIVIIKNIYFVNNYDTNIPNKIIKQEEIKQEEIKQEEIKQEEIKLEEIKPEEIKLEEIKPEENNYEPISIDIPIDPVKIILEKPATIVNSEVNSEINTVPTVPTEFTSEIDPKILQIISDKKYELKEKFSILDDNSSKINNLLSFNYDKNISSENSEYISNDGTESIDWNLKKNEINNLINKNLELLIPINIEISDADSNDYRFFNNICLNNEAPEYLSKIIFSTNGYQLINKYLNTDFQNVSEKIHIENIKNIYIEFIKNKNLKYFVP
jgi:hypothetical protein